MKPRFYMRKIEEFNNQDIKHFFESFIKTDTCWLWNELYNSGYDRFKTSIGAIGPHQFSALFHNLPNPLGKPWVLHSCDIRSCVFPGHLRWGTPQENVVDRDRRGRGYKTRYLLFNHKPR